jgi:hypothetical protein
MRRAEDVTVDVWGARAGKTTRRVIPAILDAPGPVIATSNKRDLPDATTGPVTTELVYALAGLAVALACT